MPFPPLPSFSSLASSCKFFEQILQSPKLWLTAIKNYDPTFDVGRLDAKPFKLESVPSDNSSDDVMLNEPVAKKAKVSAKPSALSIAISDSDLKEKFIELYFYHKRVGQPV